MSTGNTILADLKNSIKNGGMTTKLIFINFMVFVCIGVFEILGRNVFSGFYTFLHYVVGLATNLSEFVFRPWGLFTYMFSHFGFMHIAMNMLFLYVVGQFFEQFFSAKRLLYTYILGGLFGGLFELIVHALFPSLNGSYVIGASGSVMAVMAAIALYQPQLTVSVWGLFNVKLIYIAILFTFSNLYAVGMNPNDGVANFAHLGGILLGYISIRNPFSNANIINRAIAFVESIRGFFKPKSKSNTSFSYSKKRAAETRTYKTDEQYNVEAKRKQEKIDAILDKISKSGYESLTKEEKELLFSQSKK